MPTDLTNIQTLSYFLASTHSQYRVFDMGCRLTKLSAKSFAQFENCQVAYPMPWLKHAWVGILFWSSLAQKSDSGQKEKPDVNANANADTIPRVWFLKLPLDEQGKLIQAARDAFLSQRMEIIGAQMTGVAAAAVEEKLPKSELAFTPAQERMAAFHACSRVILKQSPSSFCQPVQQYFASQNYQDGWQQLGVQGFADVALRLGDHHDLAASVAQSIPNLPLPVLSSLAVQCENTPVPNKIAQALLMRGQQTTNDNEKIMCLRAISQNAVHHERKQWLHELLTLNAGDEVSVELLATLASKCQQDLAEPELLKKFLNVCALDTGLFNALAGELMYQPKFRQMILASVRHSQRSDQLSKAFGELLQGG